MAIKQLVHTVRSEDAGRLDRLVAVLLAVPRSQARGLIDHAGVTVNGAPCDDAGLMLAAADVVTARYEPGRRYYAKPPERAPRGFSVVHVDAHLIVVAKDAGILTVPTPRGDTNTLIDRIGVFLAKGQRPERLSVVHRLDRDTSGLLVFARSPAVARALIAQFAGHKPERAYAAIVAGHVAAESGTIRSLLASDDALNQRSAAQGELAVTHYQVADRYVGATLLEVHLETGRRNQIRVHTSEMGHPVLGDTRYRPEAAQHANWAHRRLALHARTLGFTHPVTHAAVRFQVPLPAEFMAFAKACALPR